MVTSACIPFFGSEGLSANESGQDWPPNLRRDAKVIRTTFGGSENVLSQSNNVNGGAKVGHGGGAKPGQLVRMCAMARALAT